MRPAAILGLSSSEKNLEPFKRASPATWMVGVPASSSAADVILIFGGDVTVHRHLAQLVRLQLPVLIVPRGSGNDFARALNLRSASDALEAWRQFVSGKENVRSIDLGVITSLVAAGARATPAIALRKPETGNRKPLLLLRRRDRTRRRDRAPCQSASQFNSPPRRIPAQPPARAACLPTSFSQDSV